MGGSFNSKITLGGRESQRTSHYFEKPFQKDDIVRVNATDEEVKAFFEDLVKGTSMEMKASKMTIL